MAFRKLTAILGCLKYPSEDNSDGEKSLTTTDRPADDVQITTERFINTLVTLSRNTPNKTSTLKSSLGTQSLSESLAKSIIEALESTLRKGLELSSAAKEAAEKATLAAVEFSKEHPYWCTLIALGILATMAPYVLTWLGFGEIGIVEGELALLMFEDTDDTRVLGSHLAGKICWICSER